MTRSSLTMWGLGTALRGAGAIGFMSGTHETPPDSAYSVYGGAFTAQSESAPNG